MESIPQLPNPNDSLPTLADACAVWQSCRDGGSTPIRAAARVLSDVPHYFSAKYITDLDAKARRDLPSLTRALVILDAVASAQPRVIDEWRRLLGVDGSGCASRGIKAKSDADSQIEALVSQPGAILKMPLWGFSLSENVARTYGDRFLFRLSGAFSAMPFAISRTRVSSDAFATTSFTRPRASASRASKRRAV